MCVRVILGQEPRQAKALKTRRNNTVYNGSILTGFFLYFQKTKHKKKLRQLHSQLAEAKHECSLKGFELKDEISNLKEENYSLIGESRHLL